VSRKKNKCDSAVVRSKIKAESNLYQLTCKNGEDVILVLVFGITIILVLDVVLLSLLLLLTALGIF
jgi:hypothetical protein